MAMTVNELKNVLMQSVGFDTKTETGNDRQIRLLGRVPQEGMNTWLTLLESLLRVSGESKTWSFDVSKQYFLRGDKLLYGWRLIFQGDTLPALLPEIIELISSIRPVQMSVDVPLYASPNRNAVGPNGKGARPTSGSRDSGPIRGGF